MSSSQRAVKLKLGLKRKNRKPTNDARKRQVKIQQEESILASQVLDTLEQALNGGRQGGNNVRADSIRGSPEPGFNEWEPPTFGEFEPDEHQNLWYLRDYMATPTYEDKILRQESQWRVEIPAMFEAYMDGRVKTAEWTNPLNWDADHKPLCTCPQNPRTVDVVDFMSKSIHNSSIKCWPKTYIVQM